MSDAFVFLNMKTLLLAFMTVCTLTAFVGCSCDNDRRTTTTYESASVDTKEMHHRH